MSIECITHQYRSWRRESVVGNERNFDTYLPYTPISATSTTLGGIGIHHSTVTLETGKLDTTFSHKTARLSRLSFQRARHQRPGGICSLAQLVVRDALHLAISETWELGTSQINYRTLPGNLPRRSRACVNKTFFLDRHIYIQLYKYNYINTHESSKYYKNGRKKSWNWSIQTNFFTRFRRQKKPPSQFTFFSSFSCL